ncbi:hypothetical protein [Aliiglaciecola litoralis]|uniref:DUF2846 domain-containing protein n=1 Tax=Aliiglaciecola litoralis TaxID=582857 RepID=A0ABN1LNF7_9ALTE
MKKSFIRTVIFLFILASIVGCAQTVTTLTEDSDIIEPAKISDTGYLLMAIDTSSTLQELHISGEASLKLTSKDLRQGTNYILLNVEAGNYTLDKIVISNFRVAEFNNEYWSFRIKPGAINYIGEVYAHNVGWFDKTPRFELVNNASMALEFMEDKFQNILQSRKIIYAGPGEDNFFSLVDNVSKKASQ